MRTDSAEMEGGHTTFWPAASKCDGYIEMQEKSATTIKAVLAEDGMLELVIE